MVLSVRVVEANILFILATQKNTYFLRETLYMRLLKSFYLLKAGKDKSSFNKWRLAFMWMMLSIKNHEAIYFSLVWM